MLSFYWISFAAMIISSLYLYRIKGTVSALCGVVLVSYFSFFCLHYTPYENEFYTGLDSIRIGSVMVLLLICGLKTNKPVSYLIYATILLTNLIVNGVSILNDSFFADNYYLTIAFAEIAVFCVGINKTLKARNYDNFLRYYNHGTDNCGSRAFCSVKAVSKGPTR